MRKLRNTLYVFTENAYLSLDGENIVVKAGDKEIGRIPLHTLESIFCFAYPGASPKLMQACSERDVALSFFDPKGGFLARTQGATRGNILLRRQLYRLCDDPCWGMDVARQFIAGKIFNSRWILERAIRDHGLRIDSRSVKGASLQLAASLRALNECGSPDALRGIEGDAASVYFSVFDEMILREKSSFYFKGRNRRPPTDRVNAMLSLFYSVLAADCASALEGVGLDPYCGIFHVDRPGRQSLALDLMEELRPVLVDRFVITAINNRVIAADDFCEFETGETRLSDAGRKALFGFWQERKREQIMHPYMKEKVERGLLPHVQALLLARFVRGDLDAYPVFLWK